MVSQFSSNLWSLKWFHRGIYSFILPHRPTVGALPELSLHVNDRQKAFWFGGGISSMAPCTSRGYNVQINAGGQTFWVFVCVSRILTLSRTG